MLLDYNIHMRYPYISAIHTWPDLDSEEAGSRVPKSEDRGPTVIVEFGPRPRISNNQNRPGGSAEGTISTA